MSLATHSSLRLVVGFSTGLLIGMLRDIIGTRGLGLLAVVFTVAGLPLVTLALSYPLLRYRTSVVAAASIVAGVATYTLAWQLWRDELPRLDFVSVVGALVAMLAVWAVVASMGVVSVWIRRRWFPLHEPGHCANCGYNLWGINSGRCPECGGVIPKGDAI